MFLPNSRYAKVKTVTATARGGREVQAVALRRLASPPGIATVIKGNDRLDVMAERYFLDGTMFWHIADANTEMEANELVRVPGRVILVPDK